MTESETIREKRKFAIELKQLVHQKCVEINHYVSGCDSPFSYLQIADVNVIGSLEAKFESTNRIYDVGGAVQH